MLEYIDENNYDMIDLILCGLKENKNIKLLIVNKEGVWFVVKNYVALVGFHEVEVVHCHLAALS